MLVDIDRLMTTKQAARYLTLKPITLQLWRARGYGPKYARVGNRLIRYRLSDLEAWIESRTVKV